MKQTASMFKLMIALFMTFKASLRIFPVSSFSPKRRENDAGDFFDDFATFTDWLKLVKSALNRYHEHYNQKRIQMDF